MATEWTLVSRSGKRRQRQRQPKTPHHHSSLTAYRDVIHRDPIDTSARVSTAKEDAIYSRVSRISLALRDDALLLDALREICAHFAWNGNESTSDRICAHFAWNGNESTSDRVLHVVSYGLGSFCSSSNAVYQLAYVHALMQRITQDHPHVSCSVSVFDPVMNESDRLLVQRLGLTTIERNERGRRVVSADTLFFMPHCGQALYQNVLLANWDAQRLARLAIIGNSFAAYSDRLLDRQARESSLLVRVAPFIAETALHASVPRSHDEFALYEAAFNDTSVHTFTSEQAKAATEHEALAQLTRRLVARAAEDDASDQELIVTSA
ncbi:hypothetical protein ATCC90586_009150 [Pythium insidiosum]|nr:hypothetical protein ATCC90586_009150 [Pythium insidiosum]